MSAGPDDQDPPSKKSKLNSIKTSLSLHVPMSTPMALTPSTPSLVSSPSSINPSENGFPPPQTLSSAETNVVFPAAISTLDSIFNFPSGSKASELSSTHGMSAFECGLCTDRTPCVCREMALNTPTTSFKTEATEATASLAPVALPPAPQISAQSILDNLPPYQHPVPLRRRPEVRPLRSLFPVVPLPQNHSQITPTSSAECSGDPSNCLACADDVFGQAFCAAVGESLATGGPCLDLPRDTKHTDPDSSHSNLSQEGGKPAETIPTSDAWRQLKSHPNVSFADLTLLAEVVARRSKCTGPTVVISPPPGSITPERSSSPVSKGRPAEGVDNGVVLLSDPHSHYHMKERERSACSSPHLVSEEELVQWSRTRSVREVHAAGVRDALALLDSRF